MEGRYVHIKWKKHTVAERIWIKRWLDFIDLLDTNMRRDNPPEWIIFE